MTLAGILYHNQNNYSIHYLTSNAHPKNKIHYVINISARSPLVELNLNQH